MRVIAGIAKGHNLLSPRGMDVRPTLDRVKESLFSILYPYLKDASVLDLFSGTGALGIEALSRGASACVFVDSSGESLSCTRDNLVKTKLEDMAVLEKCTFVVFLKKNTKKFDIIFLDPPYSKGIEDDVFRHIGGSLADGGVIVLETESPSSEYGGFEKIRSAKYGRVYITLYQKEVCL